MKHFLLALVVICGTSPLISVANAGLLFEPYVGYEMGSYTLKTKPTAGNYTEKGTANGTGLGLRLAYTFPAILFVGADYHYSSIKFKTTSIDDTTVSSSDSQATRSVLYALLGAQFPMGFRIYGGYGFMNRLEIESSSKPVYSGGTNMKLGLGYVFMMKFALNLEYITRTYDTYSATGVSDIALDSFVESFNDNTIMLSASVPL